MFYYGCGYLVCRHEYSASSRVVIPDWDCFCSCPGTSRSIPAPLKPSGIRSSQKATRWNEELQTSRLVPLVNSQLDCIPCCLSGKRLARKSVCNCSRLTSQGFHVTTFQLRFTFPQSAESGYGQYQALNPRATVGTSRVTYLRSAVALGRSRKGGGLVRFYTQESHLEDGDYNHIKNMHIVVVSFN